MLPEAPLPHAALALTELRGSRVDLSTATLEKALSEGFFQVRSTRAVIDIRVWQRPNAVQMIGQHNSCLERERESGSSRSECSS